MVALLNDNSYSNYCYETIVGGKKGKKKVLLALVYSCLLRSRVASPGFKEVSFRIA